METATKNLSIDIRLGATRRHGEEDQSLFAAHRAGWAIRNRFRKRAETPDEIPW
jgi:hypothetical protein